MDAEGSGGGNIFAIILGKRRRTARGLHGRAEQVQEHNYELMTRRGSARTCLALS